MPIHDLFSNRNRPRPKKLIYDSVPDAVRQHCLRIIKEGIGRKSDLLDALDDVLQREHPAPSFVRAPILSLDGRPPRFTDRFYEDCIKQGTFYEAMDAIEVEAHAIHDEIRKARCEHGRPGSGQSPDDALDELNARFMQAGVGYQFSKEQGRLVRVDSEFMHHEVTEPAMKLLTEKGFEGAAQEFEKAHHFYRQMVVEPDAGKEAVSNALKAVESTAKAIMEARAWPYEQGDTIKKLLTKLFANGLVPTDLECYFTGLRTALESGLPTLRNRMAGHGQGTKPKPIQEHMVTFGMHLAAASILFLVEAHKAKEEPAQAAPVAGPARPA
jgi:hypothetical protein